MSKEDVTPIPPQRYVGPVVQTFKRLAIDWMYHGFPHGIEFEFIGDKPKDFEGMIHTILEKHTVEDAEGYFAAVLLKAYTPDNVFTYTLDGK